MNVNLPKKGDIYIGPHVKTREWIVKPQVEPVPEIIKDIVVTITFDSEPVKPDGDSSKD